VLHPVQPRTRATQPNRQTTHKKPPAKPAPIPKVATHKKIQTLNQKKQPKTQRAKPESRNFHAAKSRNLKISKHKQQKKLNSLNIAVNNKVIKREKL
jgi:hypothetical protein